MSGPLRSLPMRSAKPLVAAALLFAALLAGCATKGTEASSTSDPGIDVKSTATTGVIKGVVVDAAIKPLVKALVTIKAGGKTLTNSTNANGGFGFSGLEPGTYFVSASKLGFAAGQTSVEVKANDDNPPTIRIALEAEKGFVKPYAVGEKFSGYIECGVGTIVILVAVCAVPNIAGDITDDTFSHFITLDAGVPSWITGELVWQSSQALGGSLKIAVRSSTLDAWNQGSYIAGVNSSTGPSPLKYAASKADIDKAGLGNNSIGLELDVFTSNGVCDPVANVCVAGATLQQKFDLITHMFYGFRPLADYRFTKDGEPKPPQ